MYKFFDDVVEKANTGNKAPVRALQAWQYLIGKAANRQLVKYDELSELMGYPDNRPMGSILGFIMFYCEQNRMPPLTLIVVNKSGVPGSGFTAEILKNYPKRREAVFDFPWYKIIPPTIEEFRQAKENS